MHTSFFTLSRKLFLCQLPSILIVTLLQFLIRVEIVHAATGTAHFDIKPIFLPFHDITPRTAFHYSSRPGALIRDSVSIKNDGTTTGTVTLYPLDATTSQTSGEVFPMSTDPRRDVGTWITLSRQQVVLNPGQHIDIPFTLRIPEHVRPGQHAGGLVAEEPDQQQTSSKDSYKTSIRVHTREVLGILIDLPGTLVEKLSAAGITYDKTSVYQRVRIGLKNTGTQFLRPSGSLQITNEVGQLLQNIPMQLEAILPQTAINYPVYMHRHALSPGMYHAMLTLEYGHMHTLSYKTDFVVPFPTLPKSITAAGPIAELVAPDTNILTVLTPWHYTVGIIFLLFLLSGIFLWSQKAYKLIINLKKAHDSKKMKKGSKHTSNMRRNGSDLHPMSLLGEAEMAEEGESKKNAGSANSYAPTNTHHHRK